MRLAEMPTPRLLFAIRQLAPKAYIVAEAARKFHTDEWESLDESDLTMLRNHLTARAAHIQWGDQYRNPEPELAEATARDDPF